jgi:hypothetical protein
MYRRLLVLAIAAGCALAASNAVAAPERVRGTIAGVSGDTLLPWIQAAGQTVPVTLTDRTRYLKVAPSSLNHVDPGAYIGTATKSIGDKLIALEVTIFPPSLKGMGEGHYAWDRTPDTTLSGVGTAPSAMTNGTVSTVSAATTVNSAMTNGTVNSAMTNGTVSSAAGSGGAKQIVVPGAAVFINAVSQGGMVTANAVAVGIDGVKPPE